METRSIFFRVFNGSDTYANDMWQLSVAEQQLDLIRWIMDMSIADDFHSVFGTRLSMNAPVASGRLPLADGFFQFIFLAERAHFDPADRS